ncbi:MAG: two-component system regulatory protein YycI [Bacillota bacterium]
MDLSRAKTVLIAAFFILNLFLLYQIWVEDGRDNPVLFGQKEEVSRLEAALQQANLSLETTLPRGGMRAAYLVVMPWQPDLEEVALNFWQLLANKDGEETLLPDDLQVIRENNDHNITICRFGSYEMLLLKEGSLLLRHAFRGLTREKLGITVDELIKRVPFLQDFVYDYKAEEEEKVVLYYRQDYEGFPLYAGYLQFSHQEEPDGDIYLYRLEPLGFAEQQREVIPPSTALWRFLETYTARDEVPTAIVEFSLGYYSEEYDAQRWEIAPVWRIRLRNGEIYYINAFTGYREN